VDDKGVCRGWSPWVEDGLLSRTRLLNRVVLATGKHFRSHSRTRQFNSARTSGSCNSAALFTCCDAIKAGLSPPPVLRCASNPRYVTPALTSARMKGVRRAWLLRARCIRSPPQLCRLSFRLAAPRASHERMSSHLSFQFIGLCRACSIGGSAPDWRPPPSRACSRRRRPEDWVPVPE
jgi:hypothetical protein